MKTSEISKIISVINADATLTTLLWWRVYLWVPKEEAQEWNYLTINIISEVVITTAEKKSRLEFRILPKDENIKFSELMTIEERLYELLTTTNDFNWFIVYKTINWNYMNWYDAKQRKYILRDLIFYYNL